jgi:RND family efflux transporter MFP subunit
MRIVKAILLLGLLAAAFLGGVIWNASRGSGAEAAKKGGRKILYWHDPMHPAYRSDKPGIAPDCGMQLVPVYADDGTSAGSEGHAQDNRKVLYWTDPQNPSYRADNPGLNPETGNELVPVHEGSLGAMPRGTVEIPPEKQQLLNIRFASAEYTAESKSIRVAGRVAMDETRVARVHTKFEGWIDKVYADFTGKFVSRGDPLLTIYSPEMLATQEEYLLALKGREELRSSTLRGFQDHMARLIEASRRRLQLWDLSEAQMDEIARTGKPIKNITVYAPADGFITTRNAFPNQQVKPEMDLYTIVDLSRVWIIADVFEADAPLVHVGNQATVSLVHDPGRTLRGRVTFILPQADPATHTLKVRLETENPGLHLKPEMFVDVDFAFSERRHLTVPLEAVLDSGVKKTVFVDRGNGLFEPREVEAGERFEDRIAILRGLKAGERVVTSGNFLIDSESQLKAAGSGMTAGGHSHD